MTEFNGYAQDWRTVNSLVLYWFNVSPSKIFDAVYGEEAYQGYKKEKVRVIEKGLARLWVVLDYPHQVRLLEAAAKHYGKET
jgi:hypothetical protein